MTQYYSIRHLTRFRYTHPITENVMEIRMQPRSEDRQRCLEFTLTTDPWAQVTNYRDFNHNIVHHFTIPGQHIQLVITAETIIQITPLVSLPQSLAPSAWEALDAIVATDEYWDMVQPSRFARPSNLLYQFADEIGCQRKEDPLTTLLWLNETIYQQFTYMPHSTTVDSPIDDALTLRRGVCQDFAHIMITLVRGLGIPCRYVSGYLFHRYEDHDRSEEDATHAWLEAFLPDLGWVGFDPTNNLVIENRHIRTAVGRDYADVPPTVGVFKGDASSELDVGVRVAPSEAHIPASEELLPVIDWVPLPHAVDEWQQQQDQ